MTDIKVKAKIWQLPNFVLFEDSEHSLHIANVSDDDLSNLADEWKKQLLLKAARARKTEQET